MYAFYLILSLLFLSFCLNISLYLFLFNRFEWFPENICTPRNVSSFLECLHSRQLHDCLHVFAIAYFCLYYNDAASSWLLLLDRGGSEDEAISRRLYCKETLWDITDSFFSFSSSFCYLSYSLSYSLSLSPTLSLSLSLTHTLSA